MATDYSKLKDTNAGRRKRQQKRRGKLNEAARAAEFESWSKLETAVISGKYELAVICVDFEESKRLWEKANSEDELPF